MTQLWDVRWEDFCPFVSTRTVMSMGDDNTGASVMNTGDGDTGAAAVVITTGTAATAATADAADVSISLHKSCMGQVSWQNIYNKMEGWGLFKNNKVCKKQRQSGGVVGAVQVEAKGF